MSFRHTTVVLASGLLLGTFAYVPAQESPSQPQLKNGSAPQTGVPQLPSSTGEFGVGRVGYECTDGSRPDRHAADSKAHRDLMVYLWYPAPKTKAGKPAEYLPGAKRMDTDAAVAPAMREEFEGVWALIVSGTISSLAIENAPVARSQKKFPVVILTPGTGGRSFEYTSLIGNLVSHGYVAAAIENTYGAPAVAFPDGRTVPAYHEPEPPNLSPDQRFQRMMKSGGQWIDTGARDIVFVLNQLTRLDDGNENICSKEEARSESRRIDGGTRRAGRTPLSLARWMPDSKPCLSLDGQMPPVAACPENPDGRWFTQPVLLP